MRLVCMRKVFTAAVAAVVLAIIGSVALGCRAEAADRSSGPPDHDAIIGGRAAPTGKWPFQVALLLYAWRDYVDAEHCGGTLVDRFHVITAAHCVDGYDRTDLRVLSGTQSLRKGGRLHKIARVQIHPSYNANKSDYDIAVVTLLNPASRIPYFAELIDLSQERTLAKPGTPAYVIGWGSTVRNSGGYPAALQEVAVPIVSRQDCNDANSYHGEITARMVCAGYAKVQKDSCDGDSGGPLIVKDEQGRWRLQAGIVSWGAFPCAALNQPGVYSRVAMLNSWAKSVIAGDAAFVAARDCERLTGEGRRLCTQARKRKVIASARPHGQ
jgi:secreted trypsin-like serine protease